MKRIILTFLISFFTSYAYADYYTYIENPEPELYELVQSDGPSANKVITDEKGNVVRACWISHAATAEITVALKLKSDNTSICSVSTFNPWDQRLKWYYNDNCIVMYGKKGNTIWINAKKANGDFGAPYKTWDCG